MIYTSDKIKIYFSHDNTLIYDLDTLSSIILNKLDMFSDIVDSTNFDGQKISFHLSILSSCHILVFTQTKIKKYVLKIGFEMEFALKHNILVYELKDMKKFKKIKKVPKDYLRIIERFRGIIK